MIRLATMVAGIAGALACLGVPGHAAAQEAHATSEAAERAGAQAWFREHIEPGLRTAAVSDRSEVLPVPLEPPPSRPPEKSTQRRLGALGPLGMLVLDVDVPQVRGDWSDVLQPQMFRLYLEPIPPKAPSPTSPTPPRGPTLPRGDAVGA